MTRNSRRQISKPLRGSACDAWIVVYEAVPVVDQDGSEVEGRRDVVVARVLAGVRQTHVALLEPLHAEASCAHIRGGSVGGLTDLEPQAIDGQRVRTRGGLEIDVEASGELDDRFAVDSPPAGPVTLEAYLALAARRSS